MSPAFLSMLVSNSTRAPRELGTTLSAVGSRDGYEYRDKGPRSCLRLQLGITVICLAGEAVSAEEPHLTAFASITSNATYRAYSKSENGTAARLNVDVVLPASQVLMGAWFAKLRFGGANAEFTPYLGKRWLVSDDLQVDTLAVAYIFDDEVFGRDASYGEAQVLMHYRDLLTLRAGAAPDAYGSAATQANVQLDVRYPLGAEVDFGAGIGYDRARATLDYDDAYWNLGLSWFPTSYLVADLRYHDATLFNGRPESGREHQGANSFESILLGPSAVFTLTLGL